jgi:hypothetical protein
MVEFALVAMLLFPLLIGMLDGGRAVFVYAEMASGAREAARQASLQYNDNSNLKAPGCNPATCRVNGVLPTVQTMTGMGIGAPTGPACDNGSSVVCYDFSKSATTPPSYAQSYQPASTPGAPGTITLSANALPNVLYVFIYEYDPNTGTTNWATADNYAGLRTGGKEVVVDLKMRWEPIALSMLGVHSGVVLDAQTVTQEEWGG